MRQDASCLHYKIFTIVLYDRNNSTIVVYDCNDSGQLPLFIHITIVNDDSIVIRMMLQVVVSPTIGILMTLEVSFMLLDNIYSTGITH